MKMLILKKQNHNEPEFDELYAMLADLGDFLNEDADFKNKDWKNNLNTVIDFQDDDGSFRLFDTYEVPTDARVDFCYMPTYICTAIIMKAYMTDESAFSLKERNALLDGLKMCCVKNLRGHGYEALKGQINALNIFFNAGLREFMDFHHDFSPEFSEMIDNIITDFRDMEDRENFLGPWGESYEDAIKAINEYFSQRKVFVYGTLMKGEVNHHYLENSLFMGSAFTDGYDMYDVGWYPAIIPGDSLIIGELYQIPKGDMEAIDMLEAEGHLYTKKSETFTDAEGKTTFAFIYVYLGDVLNLERIPAWKKDYVWYVSYGSNMLRERFMCYLQGGSFENTTYRHACRDTTPPVAIRTVEMPYCMYFGNYSGSWDGCGVSFLDILERGNALGVAYLITKEQFEHIVAEENGGRTPREGYGWYENIIDLGKMEGFEVKTVTNRTLRPYNEPCQAYWDTLYEGIRKNWPDMADEDIEDYLNDCIR